MLEIFTYEQSYVVPEHVNAVSLLAVLLPEDITLTETKLLLRWYYD